MSLGFSICSITSSAHTEFYFFCNMNSFYFSSVIVVAETSKTMLNKSGKRGHPCLVPDLRGNVFSFEYDIRCGFVMNGLYYFESCSL